MSQAWAVQHSEPCFRAKSELPRDGRRVSHGEEVSLQLLKACEQRLDNLLAGICTLDQHISESLTHASSFLISFCYVQTKDNLILQVMKSTSCSPSMRVSKEFCHSCKTCYEFFNKLILVLRSARHFNKYSVLCSCWAFYIG